MRFTVEQHIGAPPMPAARAYADPALYAGFGDLPKMSRPEVVEHRADGDQVHLQIRYRFSGELSAAAKAVLDPSRLTWVEHSVHDLANLTTTFTMVPDHYADRFQCRGSYRFEPDGDGTLRRCEADLNVRALLVARAVEGAIVSGLREHLAVEVGVVERFLAG